MKKGSWRRPRRARRITTALTVAGAVVLTGAADRHAITGLTAAPPDGTVVTSGRVSTDVTTVAMPTLSRPVAQVSTPDNGPQTSPASNTQNPTIAPAPMRLALVKVHEGDQVTAGQLLATVDDAQFRAAESLASAGVVVARRQVDVLDHAIDETRDKEAELRDKRREVEDALTTLRTTRADLIAKRSQLRSTLRTLQTNLPKLEQGLTQLDRGLTQGRRGLATITAEHRKAQGALTALTTTRNRLTAARDRLRRLLDATASTSGEPSDHPADAPTPPTPPPDTPSPDDLKARIAQFDRQIKALETQLVRVRQGERALAGSSRKVAAKVTQGEKARADLLAKRAQARAAQNKLTAALAAMTQGLARIDAGINKATDGLAKIEVGIEKIRDARRTLQHTRTQAVIGIDAASVQAKAATLTRERTAITAPTSGRITRIADVGSILAPGATVATILDDSDRTHPVLTAWIPPPQAATLCRGTRASITADWLSTEVPATLTLLGTSAEYPPSFQATDQVHLLRAIPVQVTVSDTGAGIPQLPPGTPVGLRITPCTNGTAHDTAASPTHATPYTGGPSAIPTTSR